MGAIREQVTRGQRHTPRCQLRETSCDPILSGRWCQPPVAFVTFSTRL